MPLWHLELGASKKLEGKDTEGRARVQRGHAQWQESEQRQTTPRAMWPTRTPVHRPAEAAGGLVISPPGSADWR